MSLEGMAASSIALRHKMLHAGERRLGSQGARADLFGVRLACVAKLVRRHRITGELAPKPHAGGQRPRLDIAATTLVRQLGQDNAAVTVAARCAHVAVEAGGRVSVATMCRVLQRLG